MIQKLLAFTGALILLTASVAQPIRSNASHIVSSHSTWEWIGEKWTGNNQPYQNIRAAIDKAVLEGQNLNVLEQQYKTIAQRNPFDPQSQFQWAYAAFRAVTSPIYGNAEATKDFAATLDALAKAPSPHTYDYTRLRFLRQGYFFSLPQLKGVGKRLLQRNPNDYEVEFILAATLNETGTPAERKQAMAYIQDLFHKHPNKAKIDGLLASTYYITWAHNKTQANADAAIAAYQQYLNTAPPSDHWRKSAENIIKFIQDVQAQQKKT